MYQLLISSHAHTRWLVLLAAAIAIALPFLNNSADKKSKLPALIFMIVCDLQVLLGLILYFFYSPYGIKAFENGMGFVMKTAEIRKIAVEHFVLMLAALAMVHLGYSRIKKAETADRIKRVSVVFFTVALLLIIAGIPWARL